MTLSFEVAFNPKKRINTFSTLFQRRQIDNSLIQEHLRVYIPPSIPATSHINKNQTDKKQIHMTTNQISNGTPHLLPLLIYFLGLNFFPFPSPSPSHLSSSIHISLILFLIHVRSSSIKAQKTARSQKPKYFFLEKKTGSEISVYFIFLVSFPLLVSFSFSLWGCLVNKEEERKK